MTEQGRVNEAQVRPEARPVAAPARLTVAPPPSGSPLAPIRRVVVVGAPGDIPRALDHPAVADGRFEVVAMLAVEVDADPHAEGVNTLARLLREHAAETILVAGPVGTPAMQRVVDLAIVHRCALLAVMPSEVPRGHDPVIVWSGTSPLVRLARVMQPAWAGAVKRAMDVVGSAVLLALSTPLLLVVMVLIRLESPGSPLFAHERVGLRAKRFRCLKLRTMRSGAEDVLRADRAMYDEYRRNHFKISDFRDPRITPLGRFLRRTSIDELPQLWNVIAGDMSLVGPRPVVADELAVYGDAADLLVSVRPGITGAWAVGGRHNVGYPERCELELDYVRHRSIAHDLAILVRTTRAVIDPR